MVWDNDGLAVSPTYRFANGCRREKREAFDRRADEAARLASVNECQKLRTGRNGSAA